MRTYLDAETFSRRVGSVPAGVAIRSITGSPQLTNDSGRLIRYRFSDTSVARDGDVIAAGAWQLDSFLKNPVFLWAHDSSEPPIGRIVDIGEYGGVLSGTVEYPPADVSPFADSIFRMVKAGYLNATSVGFIPLEYKRSTDKNRPNGLDFTLVDLLEISQVPVPSLPTALVTARSAGIDTTPFVRWAEKNLDRKGDGFMPRDQFAAIRRAAGAPLAHPVSNRENAIATGFPTLAHQLRAIAEACRDYAHFDPRLVRAPLGMNEGDGSAGGFLIQTNFVQELVAPMYEEAEIAPLCDRRETSNPLANIKVPAIDETSRADGSRWGGTMSYWAAEADTVPTSLPKFRQLEFSAKKIICIVYGTSELMADAPMWEAHVKRAFAAEAAFKLDLAIHSGSGAGQPVGITKASGTITVAKESGQTAGTIIVENIRKMWSRLPASSRKRAVWLVNEDAEEQLEQMANATTNQTAPTAQALYMPAGVGGNPYPLLKGRPVIAIEQAPALGQLGDIVLADLSRYIVIDGGTVPAISAHVRFVNDEAVWRFVMRVDGQPSYASPVTPYNGTVLRSPFVMLQAR